MDDDRLILTNVINKLKSDFGICINPSDNFKECVQVILENIQATIECYDVVCTMCDTGIGIRPVTRKFVHKYFPGHNPKYTGTSELEHQPTNPKYRHRRNILKCDLAFELYCQYKHIDYNFVIPTTEFKQLYGIFMVYGSFFVHYNAEINKFDIFLNLEEVKPEIEEKSQALRETRSILRKCMQQYITPSTNISVPLQIAENVFNNILSINMKRLGLLQDPDDTEKTIIHRMKKIRHNMADIVSEYRNSLNSMYRLFRRYGAYKARFHSRVDDMKLVKLDKDTFIQLYDAYDPEDKNTDSPNKTIDRLKREHISYTLYHHIFKDIQKSRIWPYSSLDGAMKFSTVKIAFEYVSIGFEHFRHTEEFIHNLFMYSFLNNPSIYNIFAVQQPNDSGKHGEIQLEIKPDSFSAFCDMIDETINVYDAYEKLHRMPEIQPK